MQLLSTKWGPIVVSVLVALIFGLVMFLLLTKSVPNADSDLMKILAGGLSAKFGDMVSFWLGSSAGSKAKDDIVASAAPIERK